MEYTLTHSGFPFAAAIAADNMNGGYVQSVLRRATVMSSAAQMNGDAPFGEGLHQWLQSSPGFNVDKIHTPLRIEIDTGGLVGALDQWELFSLLRTLEKPVELFIVPDGSFGAHPLQMPAQKIASQGATVDWMDFWLNAREDPNPAKTDQYVRWRKLRETHEADQQRGPVDPRTIYWGMSPR